jgi:hypothetical protein
MGNTGREVYKYMARSNSKDTVNTLKRRDPSTIFRLRTQHIQLNSHLNRIQPHHAPVCHLCTHPSENVDHHLSFECPALDSIRKIFFLSLEPYKWNTLYGTSQELTNTCIYHYMALSQRADAHRLLDQ